jgi:hypothetical protein
MTETNESELPPTVVRAIAQLQRPMDLGAGVEERVLATLRSEPSSDARPRRGWGHITAIGGIALAAGLATIVLGRIGVGSAPSGHDIRFSITAEAASRVSVVGDFNDWNPTGTPLRRVSDGEWSVTLPLSPGRYRFGFLLDGHTWISDPRLPAAPDPDFGTPTSVITVERSAL